MSKLVCMATKTECRKRLFAQRKQRALSPTIDELDRRIAANVVQEITRVGSTRVSAYYPTSGEPGGRFLVPTLKQAGFTVFLPLSLDGGQLAWAEYIDDDHMAPGAYNIPEPTTDRVDQLTDAHIDFVIVPALGADRAGHRLGKGGGYYDRLLAANPSIPRAMVVYADEVLEHIPYEAHDTQCDVIITN